MLTLDLILPKSGDKVIDLRNLDHVGVVHGGKSPVYVDWTFMRNDGELGAWEAHEHVPYDLDDVKWDAERNAWTIDCQGIGAHEMATRGL